MNKYTKWLLLVLIALVPSLLITRSDTRYNASPCLYTEVCQEKSLGTKKTVQYGFPASYDQVTTFTPLDSSKPGLTDQGGDKDYILIVANILFWIAVLTTGLKLFTKIRTK